MSHIRPYVEKLPTAFTLLLLLHSCRSSAHPQGARKLPYMTTNVDEVAGKYFDYIVVGGGTAGCPIAATLSEKFSVLLIERGGSPYGNTWITEKRFLGFALLPTETDEFSSVSQSFTSKEGIANFRGRVLGGTTAINGGFYSRASDEFVTKSGWDKQLVKESYEWVESKIITKPELTTWQATVQSAFLEAGILPDNGFTWEHIEGTKIGGSIFDSRRKRHTSADLLQVGRPENIIVLLNATVKSVIFNNGESEKTTARGIQFISSHGTGDRTYEAYINRPANRAGSSGDVILSAGALGSPQILLLSGIGPKSHLNQLKIPLVLESNHVGREVQDNPGISILVGSIPGRQLPDPPQVAGITKGFNFIIQGIIGPISFNTTRNRISIKLAFPESKGKLELNSTDPRKNPEVLYNYLGTEKDMDGCVEMVKLALTVAKYLPRETNLVSNPDELRTYCRKNVASYFHFHGGCVLGSVVDVDYRVVGVNGLRVVDGSTFLESPGTNPMATVLMLGRYQGMKILAERKKSPQTLDMDHIRPHCDKLQQALTLLLLLLLHSCRSSAQPRGTKFPYMTSNVNEVAGKSFDYIVVGGGTAGCPLAATLSERFTVLLIERGGSPYGNPWITDKLFYGFPLLQTDEFSSVSQSFTSKEGVPNHRGRVLGGSTAINGGFYSRASDNYVRTVGWDEELVKESYEWVESKIITKPVLTKWQAAVQSGFLEAGILPDNGFTWEHIQGTKVGGSTFDKSGKRHTSADLLQAGQPENIIVLLNATVKSVVFDNGESNKTIARGIQFISSNGNGDRTYEAYLNHPENPTSGDVILSAGALGSPQILLLSGIGPKPHLSQLNIPIVLESNGVGQEVKDNPSVSILVDSNPEYRVPDSPQVAGITKGSNFVIESLILPFSLNTTRIVIAVKLAFPESKGKLELNSTDPRKNPQVSYNYLETQKDMDGCVEMTKLMNKVAGSWTVEAFPGNAAQGNFTMNPDELRTLCRRNVWTFYHYHGGCVVGSVVDQDYRVVGVEGLRVVDGSTFLESPGTNPMATVLMLGRYQGIKILAEREIINGRLLAALTLLLLLKSCQGWKLPYMTSNVDEVAGKSFDYIVVGGGAAGCPIAATLSEKFSVLLIERGGSPYGNPWITEKRFFGFPMLQTDEFSSVSQSFTSKEGVANFRGRVLGGSTAINGGFYSRASDNYVRTAGWDKQLVKKSYEWVESKIVTKPTVLTMWQAAFRSGLLEAGILPDNGFTLEHVEGTKIGGSIFDNRGKRHTSADLLQAGRPENIIVLLNGTVKSVVFDNGESNKKIVRSIQFISSNGDGDQTYEAYLNHPQNPARFSSGDVILSAGTLGSPQLLLLSGIGPKPHLSQLNIPLVLESNQVGCKIQDNPGIFLLVDSKPENRLTDASQVAGITKGFNFILHAGIARISPNATRIALAAKVAFPESRGNLELNSTDPRKNPEVSYNYLETEKDMDRCVELTKLLYKVAGSPSVEWFPGNVAQGNLTNNPDELRSFCRKNVRSYYHYHGGCGVGSVVDQDYRVVGVEGLRVVDGSTFQETPGTNPMATVLMLGRYQGIKILAERKIN
ncbi:(R)-mandelonitrile lyase-like [Linum grandiflorum]